MQYATSAEGNCLFSVSGHDAERRMIAFAPSGGDLPAFFRELPAAVAHCGATLTTIKHVPGNLSDEVARNMKGVRATIRGPEHPPSSKTAFHRLSGICAPCCPMRAKKRLCRRDLRPRNSQTGGIKRGASCGNMAGRPFGD